MGFLCILCILCMMHSSSNYTAAGLKISLWCLAARLQECPPLSCTAPHSPVHDSTHHRHCTVALYLTPPHHVPSTASKHGCSWVHSNIDALIAAHQPSDYITSLWGTRSLTAMATCMQCKSISDADQHRLNLASTSSGLAASYLHACMQVGTRGASCSCC